MLDMLERELNKLNLFDESTMPEIVKAVANSIPSQTLPYRMKLAIAISEIITFIGQFRVNIHHWNDSIIPINAITFCIAKSGASKDSSVKAARKCFKGGYDILNRIRRENAVNKAIQLAREDGVDVPDRFSGYKDYYKAPNPLFASVSTAEGFIQHCNDLSEDTLGAGYIYSTEFGVELASNNNMMDMLRLVAELYDMGNKEVKLLKSRENQSKEITELPVSAFFATSADNLIFDDSVKKKFKLEFTARLARRSFVVFAHEDIELEDYNSIEQMLKREREIENEAIKIRNEVDEYIAELTPNLISFPGEYLEVSDEVRDYFNLYKRYNEALSDTIDIKYQMSKITRAHLQWKALKLSGALCLVQGGTKIELDDYKAAIAYVESINEDLGLFEREMTKEPYELFVDYVKKNAIDNQYSISLHDLRKGYFISNSMSTNNAMKELVSLANSCDMEGAYQVVKDTIHYTALTKTDSVLLSYLPCSGTKEERARKCRDGYVCESLTFADLGEMLEGDYAYSPFRFTNGVRGKDNIESGCKWIVLDIDSSEITDYEAHILLSDLNHYVARTSNKDNPNKFRILLELDTELNIADIQWKSFIQAVTNDLGIVADPLSKAQIFYSYAGRDIYSVTDGMCLEVKPYLDNLAAPKKTETPKGKEAKQDLLNNPLTTFEAAFEAPDGKGRCKLIWACKYARELGADREYCKNLLRKITKYWVKGFPEKDLEVMFNQLDRWVF